jgi:hypothetical protein
MPPDGRQGRHLSCQVQFQGVLFAFQKHGVDLRPQPMPQHIKVAVALDHPLQFPQLPDLVLEEFLGERATRERGNWLFPSCGYRDRKRFMKICVHDAG